MKLNFLRRIQVQTSLMWGAFLILFGVFLSGEPHAEPRKLPTEQTQRILVETQRPPANFSLPPVGDRLWESKPNIVVILADDLGYADFSPFAMPNSFDLMTSRGTTLPFYTGQSCVATRTALMTGIEPSELGLQNVKAPPEYKGLPASVVTLPEMLGKAGYKNYMVGKWHLGHGKSNYPTRRGFHEFVGLVGGHINSYGTSFDGKPYADGTLGHDHHSRHDMTFNGVSLQSNKYSTTLFRDAAKTMVRNANEPFFLYVAFNAPHGPYSAPRRYFDLVKGDHKITKSDERYLATYANGVLAIPKGKKVPAIIEKRLESALYYAAVRSLDDAIVGIYREVEKTQRADNTIFIFASDNGGQPRGPGSNLPLRDGKGFPREGGIKVANFIIWPEQISPGQEVTQPVWIGDLMPTFAKLAGTKSPDVSGGNALGALLRDDDIWRGNTRRLVTATSLRERVTPDRRYLEGSVAVVLGHRKYMRWIHVSTDFKKTYYQREELYDLRTDARERKNLIRSSDHSALVAMMRKNYRDWGGDRRLLSLEPNLQDADWSKVKHIKEWGVINTRLRSKIFP